jgi:predicted dehydrogenase
MVNLAIVGLGSWGRKLVEATQGVSSDVRFATAVVRRADTAETFAKARGLRLETDIAKALADPAIDGVVASGPAHLHAAHGLAALEAGKHAMVIKPLALAAGDAVKMLEAAERRGLVLALGYNRCFYPNVVEMRRRLAVGALGDLVHAEGDFCVDRYRTLKGTHWKANPEYSPAGGLADHMLYLAIDTLGEMAEVHALAHRHHSDNALADATAVLLRTKNRQSAVLTAIGVTPDYYRFQVFGTKGWIEIRDDNRFSFQSTEGAREDVVFQSIDAERAEIEAFAAAIRGERAFPVPAAQAVHGVAVLEAIGRSAIEDRPARVD